MRTRTSAALAVMAVALWAAPARADSVFSVPGFHSAGTPQKFNKVQVRRFGSPSAPNVLVLVPGTLGGAGDFQLVAPYLASHVPHLQVWAEMRREGALEDNSMLLRGLAGTASVQQVFDYYQGWLANPSISPHYQPLTNAQTAFAKQWGLNTAMEDLHRVITKARARGKRRVILGGHSLGGSEAAIYPAWDFHGRAGYKDLAGIVGIDGGVLGRPAALASRAQAQAALKQLDTSGPWRDILGFGLPWVQGPLTEIGALTVLKEPNAASIAQQFPLLPKSLDPGVPVTNAAQFGFAFDQKTSPSFLALIQVHSGHVSPTGSPQHGWVNDGITPIENVAKAFGTEPLPALDWYYPQRLTIDVGAAGAMRQTPAARFLGLHLQHLRQVDIPYYAFQAALGGRDNGVVRGARAYKRKSHVPSVTVVNRASTYAHLDPLLADPARNDFLKTVVPWLRRRLR